ncbi:MAG: GNAT family N-acetyltransferase [Rhodospirillaceae bacterium]
MTASFRIAQPSDGFAIDAMTRAEAQQLFDWAAAEGWNPGLADLDIAWATDPDAFIALRETATDALAGGGTIFRHGPGYGFMGLFILRSDLRRQGLGQRLWHWRRDRLLARLESGATIGMDGVFEMAAFYERGGFAPVYRDLRFQGLVPTSVSSSGPLEDPVVALGPGDLAAIEALDRRCFPCPRTDFLARWLGQPGAVLRGIRADASEGATGDALAAFGMTRPCRNGVKVGPLYAETPDQAEAILRALMAETGGLQMQWDLPEANPAAVALAHKIGFEEVFGCVRQYHGPAPDIALGQLYGVTSLEFG